MFIISLLFHLLAQVLEASFLPLCLTTTHITLSLVSTFFFSVLSLTLLFRPCPNSEDAPLPVSVCVGQRRVSIAPPSQAAAAASSMGRVPNLSARRASLWSGTLSASTGIFICLHLCFDRYKFSHILFPLTFDQHCLTQNVHKFLFQCLKVSVTKKNMLSLN